MAVRLEKRRNEELVSGNHIVLHKFMNFQGRAMKIVELVERYDITGFANPGTECWVCLLPDAMKELFVFGKIDNFTIRDYERFKSE